MLWTLHCGGRERRTPGEGYWWENARRSGSRCVLQITVSGEMTFVHEGRTHCVGAGRGVLFRYGDSSSYGLSKNTPSPLVTEWVSFRGSGLAEHWQELTERYGPVVAIESPVRDRIRRALKLTRDRRADRYARVAAAHDLIVRMEQSLRSTSHQSQSPVDGAIQRLMDDPTYPWSLKALAARAGVSREHLTRVFARRTGQGPAAWLKARRLERACELLVDTSLPVSEIAFQCGFSSSHDLGRTMRRRLEQSPSQFRRAAVDGRRPDHGVTRSRMRGRRG